MVGHIFSYMWSTYRVVCLESLTLNGYTLTYSLLEVTNLTNELALQIDAL